MQFYLLPHVASGRIFARRARAYLLPYSSFQSIFTVPRVDAGNRNLCLSLLRQMYSHIYPRIYPHQAHRYRVSERGCMYVVQTIMRCDHAHCAFVCLFLNLWDPQKFVCGGGGRGCRRGFPLNLIVGKRRMFSSLELKTWHLIV